MRGRTDYWARLDKRSLTDGEIALNAAEDALHDAANPHTTARLFLDRLADPLGNRHLLTTLVVPSDAWGDFSRAARILHDIPDWGLPRHGAPALGDSRVQYFAILPWVNTSFRVNRDEVVGVAAFVTLVFSVQRDKWLVYTLGRQIRPDEMSHVA